MGFRFRKSINLGGGLKLNIGKKSMGLSAGVPGAKVSVNSNKKVTGTVSVPGTGLSYSSTKKIGKTNQKVEIEQIDNVIYLRQLQKREKDLKLSKLINYISLFIIFVMAILTIMCQAFSMTVVFVILFLVGIYINFFFEKQLRNTIHLLLQQKNKDIP